MRKCIECSKLKIKLSEPHWKDTCFSCYKKQLINNKRCDICKKLSINKESIKNICNSCYIQEYKKCEMEDCDKYIIGEENLWKDICGSCYLKNKNNLVKNEDYKIEEEKDLKNQDFSNISNKKIMWADMEDE